MKKEVAANKKSKNSVAKLSKMCAKITALATIVVLNINVAFADPPNLDVLSKIDAVVSNILTYVAIGGALVMLFGVFSVIMAIREEDAGRKSSGILNIVVGALLVSLKVVVWNVIKGLIGVV